MKIFITSPGIVAPHGGIRIILEWANRLSVNHEVTLYVDVGGLQCKWFKILPQVKLTDNAEHMAGCDCLIITSPRTSQFQNHAFTPEKVFLFMQGMDANFYPDDPGYQFMCNVFYRSPHPIIGISKWNMEVVRERYDNNTQMFYVGNGVNFEHFPLENNCPKGKVLLVEGWMPKNRIKDTDRIAARVAAHLKKQGWRVLAYSQKQLVDDPYHNVLDEYYCCPTLEEMNSMYRRAKVMIKASKEDARACAPMEAMTKKTVTFRALDFGDDDLIHEYNCLRCGYNYEEFLDMVMNNIYNTPKLERLSENAFKYVQEYSWDYWMPQIERILCS